MKKYSLKMNDFFSLFVSEKHLWQLAKPKHYVNKTHSPRKADLEFKFGQIIYPRLFQHGDQINTAFRSFQRLLCVAYNSWNTFAG